MSKSSSLIALLGLITFGVQSLLAQRHNFQKEINDQVWKPFLQSFDNYDPGGFMSVHHPEALRVVQDDRKILSFREYARQTEESMPKSKLSGDQRRLELRFTERSATIENAFEVGFYKLTVSRPNGTTDTYYGKFHVVLKKTDGAWKIWLDADTSEGADEEAFRAAIPME
jgi:hypothetical protein